MESVRDRLLILETNFSAKKPEMIGNLREVYALLEQDSISRSVQFEGATGGESLIDSRITAAERVSLRLQSRRNEVIRLTKEVIAENVKFETALASVEDKLNKVSVKTENLIQRTIDFQASLYAIETLLRHRIAALPKPPDLD